MNPAKINKAFFEIALNMIPILLMILFIHFVQNDYTLAIIFIIIIALALLIKYNSGEYIFFIFGFFVITFFEWVFVSMGAEIFLRRSLFSTMPIWLPILWAYAFIAVKRGIESLNRALEL